MDYANHSDANGWAISGQRVEATFDYREVVAPDARSARQRRSVSPGKVRAVVLHALTNGWHPEQRGHKPMRFNGESLHPVD